MDRETAKAQVLSEALDEARREERRRLADLIKENAGVFAECGSDKETAVRLVALAVGLGT